MQNMDFELNENNWSFTYKADSLEQQGNKSSKIKIDILDFE